MAKSKFTENNVKAWNDSWKKGSLPNSLGAIGSGITGIADAALSNARIDDTSDEEAEISNTSNTQFGSGSYDNLLSSFNAMDMAKSNYKVSDIRGLSTGQMVGNTLKGIGSGAAAGAQIGGLWGAGIGGAAGLLGGLGGIAAGYSKARDKARELNTEARRANEKYLANFENAVSNTHNTMFNSSLLNIAAKGGKLYIKPMRYFNNGGLVHQHGGIFSNGITFIGNGGTHEQNPFEGVQIGVDAQGIPNMVEEGEVIWQDYVFSNRLKPTKEFKDKYKIKGETFADAANEMQKESEERVNDSISKRGLNDSMMKLMLEQEKVRSTSKRNTSNSMFAGGGKITNTNRNKNNKFAWGGYPFEDEKTEVNYKGMSPDVVDAMNEEAAFTAGRQTGMSDEVIESIKRQKTTGVSESTTTPTTKSVDSDPKVKGPKSGNSWLRYAPAIGSAMGVFSDLLGITNKPDYSNTKLIQDATDRIKPISYTPIGTYLSYNPFDKNFYSARLAEQAGATRRAISNQATNPGAAMAGLLASDYNAQTQLGGLFRQAEEYNQAQREKVAGFNRQTDAINSEMAMKAAIANQKSDELRLKSAMAQTQLREQADATASAARSANLTNMFDNLGAVGKESFIMNIIENNPALLYNWLGEYKGKACGGKINRKRRK